jgi:hypothetical protein
MTHIATHKYKNEITKETTFYIPGILAVNCEVCPWQFPDAYRLATFNCHYQLPQLMLCNILHRHIAKWTQYDVGIAGKRRLRVSVLRRKSLNNATYISMYTKIKYLSPVPSKILSNVLTVQYAYLLFRKFKRWARYTGSQYTLKVAPCTPRNGLEA